MERRQTVRKKTVITLEGLRVIKKTEAREGGWG